MASATFLMIEKTNKYYLFNEIIIGKYLKKPSQNLLYF